MLSFPTTCLPVHRSILAVDIERSTGPLRTNPIKQDLRRTLYQLLGEALEFAGIGTRHCEFTDRGDGVMVLVQPSDEIPKTLLLNPLIPELTRLLAGYNASLPPDERVTREMRVRAVIHAGEVHSDPKGPFGEEVDVACRLLDAPRFKQVLREMTGPLALVVSEDIYWSIIKHRYEGICADSFAQTVQVRCAGRRRRGWVQRPMAAPLAALQPLHAGAA